MKYHFKKQASCLSCRHRGGAPQDSWCLEKMVRNTKGVGAKRFVCGMDTPHWCPLTTKWKIIFSLLFKHGNEANTK